MNKKPEIPHYSMSQADLVTTAHDKINFLSRDLEALAERGMTTAAITGLKVRMKTFVNLPTEAEGVQLTAAATIAKDTTRDASLALMQDVMGKVRLRNGDTTPAYKAFGTAGLNSVSDADLYVGLVRTVRVGRAQLATYAEKGLTATNLNDLEVSNELFLEQLGIAHDLAAAAEEATQARLRAANALYGDLVDACEVGKSTFVQTNVAKYNDYVIYDHSSGNATPDPEAA